jgi:hypothetical protein
MPVICVLIPVSAEEPGLVETLASLVPAVVTGLVRTVVVADLRSDPALRVLCEDCGCHYSDAKRDGLGPAIAAMRSEWILAVAPGFVLIEPWLTRLREFGAMSRDGGAVFLMPSRRRSWLAPLADRFQPIERRAAAVVLRRQCLTGSSLRTWDDITRALKRLSTRTDFAHCVVDLRTPRTAR